MHMALKLRHQILRPHRPQLYIPSVPHPKNDHLVLVHFHQYGLLDVVSKVITKQAL